MVALAMIRPPKGETDTAGAQRVFEEFFLLYQPTLTRAERYLEKAVKELQPEYAEGYQPWLRSLQQLLRGVYLVVKKIPMPDTESFLESLRTFSFDSAIEFLRDICVSSRISLSRDWTDRFREHINLLLFSAAILNRQQQALERQPN